MGFTMLAALPSQQVLHGSGSVTRSIMHCAIGLLPSSQHSDFFSDSLPSGSTDYWMGHAWGAWASAHDQKSSLRGAPALAESLGAACAGVDERGLPWLTVCPRNFTCASARRLGGPPPVGLRKGASSAALGRLWHCKGKGTIGGSESPEKLMALLYEKTIQCLLACAH